ncbi:MAG: phosphate starvation-inducible protein PhoH [Marinilabiliales bacterium]|nr:MAG: phosphate starvation-inducible protein PhoH [Marinilabiliales bacterium]
MTEQVFDLQLIDHVAFFGVQDRNLNELRLLFPKLKLIVRGDMLKAIGDEKVIKHFADRFSLLLKHFEVYGKLTKKDIESLVLDEEKDVDSIANTSDDVIVFGRNGKPIKARTENQRKMFEDIRTRDMMFAIGPAGTGKTYTAVALAVRYLKEKAVKRIVLTRPAVEAGESLGFLPGDLRDKLDPYLQPLYDALRDMLPHQKLLSYFEDSTIEIAPLAFMRGRTLDNAFVILDEAQNCTSSQMKMFLTRMGHNSKFVITGDITQIDLPRNQSSGLIHAVHLFENVKDISVVRLGEKDVIRHPLVTKIIKTYDNENKDS